MGLARLGGRQPDITRAGALTCRPAVWTDLLRAVHLGGHLCRRAWPAGDIGVATGPRGLFRLPCALSSCAGAFHRALLCAERANPSLRRIRYSAGLQASIARGGGGGGGGGELRRLPNANPTLPCCFVRLLSLFPSTVPCFTPRCLDDLQLAIASVIGAVEADCAWLRNATIPTGGCWRPGRLYAAARLNLAVAFGVPWLLRCSARRRAG